MRTGVTYALPATRPRVSWDVGSAAARDAGEPQVLEDSRDGAVRDQGPDRGVDLVAHEALLLPEDHAGRHVQVPELTGVDHVHAGRLRVAACQGQQRGFPYQRRAQAAFL